MPDARGLVAGGIVAGYLSRSVLLGVSLQVSPGEVVALIGHNGAGKSTLLKALFGLVPLQGGTVEYFGDRQVNLAPRSLVRLGVAYLPQTNLVFPRLTVEQNLLVPAWNSLPPTALSGAIEDALRHFPSLEVRRRDVAGILSGGQQKMLAMARALLARPRLLLADEPTAGLAVPAGRDVLTQLANLAREKNVAILLVEQSVRQAVEISDRVYVLRNGRFSFSGPADELREESLLRSVYLL